MHHIHTLTILCWATSEKLVFLKHPEVAQGVYVLNKLALGALCSGYAEWIINTALTVRGGGSPPNYLRSEVS